MSPAISHSPLVDVVVSVGAPSFGQGQRFEVLLRDRTAIALKVGILENPTEFSPSHPFELETTSAPIRVFCRLEDGLPVVYRLEDTSS